MYISHTHTRSRLSTFSSQCVLHTSLPALGPLNWNPGGLAMCVVCDQIRARVTSTSILVMRVHVYVYGTVSPQVSRGTCTGRDGCTVRTEISESRIQKKITTFSPNVFTVLRMNRQRHSQSLLHLGIDSLLSPQSTHTETDTLHCRHVHVSIAELLQPLGLTPRVFDRARDRAH